MEPSKRYKEWISTNPRRYKLEVSSFGNQEELYRKLWDGPLLLCVSAEDIPKVLVEVYEDLVLRSFSASHPKEQNKLSPKWERPYLMKRILGPGTYQLEDLDVWAPSAEGEFEWGTLGFVFKGGRMGMGSGSTTSLEAPCPKIA
ncbi:hypothetical protein LIER_26346 [Lithospermum erythrorhizon]|uniref:Uncharacterized protein n=1 Tax=Lithospermum erythrorhizon TaxID=34254 RepID=A0AAV3R9I5_LITER